MEVSWYSNQTKMLVSWDSHGYNLGVILVLDSDPRHQPTIWGYDGCWAKNIIWLVVFATPLKNDGVKVSWDDFPFATEWKVINFMFQTTNQ